MLIPCLSPSLRKSQIFLTGWNTIMSDPLKLIPSPFCSPFRKKPSQQVSLEEQIPYPSQSPSRNCPVYSEVLPHPSYRSPLKNPSQIGYLLRLYSIPYPFLRDRIISPSKTTLFLSIISAQPSIESSVMLSARTKYSPTVFSFNFMLCFSTGLSAWRGLYCSFDGAAIFMKALSIYYQLSIIYEQIGNHFESQTTKSSQIQHSQRIIASNTDLQFEIISFRIRIWQFVRCACVLWVILMLCVYYSIVRRQQSMFQSFLTSIEQQSSQRQSRQDPNSQKELYLKESIKNLLSSLSRNRQLCRQAAINIGLSLQSLDFEKIFKLINGECNLSTLNFTFSQLKTLQKECNKISKAIGKNEMRADVAPFFSLKKGQALKKVDSQPERKEEEPINKVQKALEEEIAFRIKQKKFNSTESLFQKTEYLKKLSEKAKSMNKRAFKIYVNHKQKEQKQIETFEMASEYTKPILHKAEQNFQTTSNTHIISVSNSQEKEPPREAMKQSIFDDSFRVPTQKCKTAASKYRARVADSIERQEENEKAKERFLGYRKKQNETRERRQLIESAKQQQIISKFIYKQEKLIEIQNQFSEEKRKKEKKLAKIANQTLTSTKTQKFDEDFENGIRQRCEQKVFKKQMLLNDRVNRIREQQKLKQQRRQRFKLRKQREHEEKQSLNEYYLKSYIERCSRLKDNQFKHESTIRKRHQLLLEKENQERIAQSLSKLTDAELLKFTQIISKNQHSRSFNLQSTL